MLELIIFNCQRFVSVVYKGANSFKTISGDLRQICNKSSFTLAISLVLCVEKQVNVKVTKENIFSFSFNISPYFMPYSS